MGIQRYRPGAVIVGALFYFGLLPGGASVDPARTSLIRFDVPTGPSDTPTSFALSPDGRRLVFAATRDGDSMLWVRDLDQTVVRPLPGTEQASFPFWSPDGRAVGFFSERKLKRLDLDGGSVRVLADAPNGRGGAWSTDGTIIYTPSNTLFQPDSALMQVPASGGAPLPLTHLGRGEGSHRWPQFLPDGRRFLFFMTLGTIESEGMYLGSLDGWWGGVLRP